VKAQTRAYAERVDDLVAQLRQEIGAPAAPAGSAALVVLMGYPGVGKSHCARLLAARLGAALVAQLGLYTAFHADGRQLALVQVGCAATLVVLAEIFELTVRK